VKGRDRFQPIVQGLLIRNNEPLRVACLTLINALISAPDDLDFRYLVDHDDRSGSFY
jgi:hypothetical protein